MYHEKKVFSIVALITSVPVTGSFHNGRQTFACYDFTLVTSSKENSETVSYV